MTCRRDVPGLARDHCRPQKHSCNVQLQEEECLPGPDEGEEPRLNVVVAACQGGRSGMLVLDHSKWCHHSEAPPCL